MSDGAIILIMVVVEAFLIGLSLAIWSFLHWAAILFFLVGQILIIITLLKING